MLPLCSFLPSAHGHRLNLRPLGTLVLRELQHTLGILGSQESTNMLSDFRANWRNELPALGWLCLLVILLVLFTADGLH